MWPDYVHSQPSQASRPGLSAAIESHAGNDAIEATTISEDGWNSTSSSSLQARIPRPNVACCLKARKSDVVPKFPRRVIPPDMASGQILWAESAYRCQSKTCRRSHCQPKDRNNRNNGQNLPASHLACCMGGRKAPSGKYPPIPPSSLSAESLGQGKALVETSPPPPPTQQGRMSVDQSPLSSQGEGPSTSQREDRSTSKGDGSSPNESTEQSSSSKGHDSPPSRATSAKSHSSESFNPPSVPVKETTPEEVKQDQFPVEPWREPQPEGLSPQRSDLTRVRNRTTLKEHELDIGDVTLRESYEVSDQTSADGSILLRTVVVHTRAIGDRVHQVRQSARPKGHNLVTVNTTMTEVEVDQFESDWTLLWRPAVTEERLATLGGVALDFRREGDALGPNRPCAGEDD